MGRRYSEEDIVWKKQFGKFLRKFFYFYNLDYNCFAEQYHWSPSTIRYWFYGRNLPQQRTTLEEIKTYFIENIIRDPMKAEKIYQETKSFFEMKNVIGLYNDLRHSYPDMNTFAGELLTICYDMAKNNDITNIGIANDVPSTKTTQVVIFDFDGTLIYGKDYKTIWENLWTSLDYDITDCQDLHMRYNRHEITHVEWCKLTEENFQQRNLHRETVDKLASKIKLIKGTKETFRELKKRNIQIYIVSGSILSVIKSVLGNLCQCVESIEANQFLFDQNGFLAHIIGTEYDFEGKKRFIDEIASSLNIPTKNILFIGNSVNDRFAHLSGARTLCINPTLTDVTDRAVWNDCIQTCTDLREILKYL